MDDCTMFDMDNLGFDELQEVYGAISETLLQWNEAENLLKEVVHTISQ